MALSVRRFAYISYLIIKDDWDSTLLLGTASALDAVAAVKGVTWTQFMVVLLRALIYYWGYALTHCAYNQLHCDEDRKNKPHRPIVSGACTLEEAKKVFVIGAFIFLVTAYCLGVFPYAAWWVAEVVVVSEWVHNGWWKNFYSAFGFYLMLAASWLLGGQTFEKSFLLPFSTSALHIFSLPLKVFLTVWVQDFRDIEGDVAHERITTPVVFGEQKARYIMLWLFAVACPFLIFVTLMSPDVALTKVIFVTACMSAALIWLGVVLLYSTSRQTDDWLYHSYIKWFGALILLRLALKLI